MSGLASRKMGATIQFEGHKNELSRIQELEHVSDVIEFYDQPPSIKPEYQSAAGKKLGVLHTPDFFVIRETSAGWEECLMEEELNRLAEKSPNCYCVSHRPLGIMKRRRIICEFPNEN